MYFSFFCYFSFLYHDAYFECVKCSPIVCLKARQGLYLSSIEDEQRYSFGNKKTAAKLFAILYLSDNLTAYHFHLNKMKNYYV